MNHQHKLILMNIIKSLSIAFIIVSLSSCGSNAKTVNVKNTKGYQQNHGPFDSNGNYIESWADNAPKRKFSWGKSKVSSKTKSTYKPKSTKLPSKTSSYKPKTAVAKTSPTRKAYTAPKKSSSTSRTTTNKKTTIRKSTAKKITPRAKPPVSHIVKKGDTLYGLSRKYGTSVSVIQKANALKGNSISTGRRLIIPRR